MALKSAYSKATDASGDASPTTLLAIQHMASSNAITDASTPGPVVAQYGKTTVVGGLPGIPGPDNGSQIGVTIPGPGVLRCHGYFTVDWSAGDPATNFLSGLIGFDAAYPGGDYEYGTRRVGRLFQGPTFGYYTLHFVREYSASETIRFSVLEIEDGGTFFVGNVTIVFEFTPAA